MGSVGWGDVADDNVNNDYDDDVEEGENYDAAKGMVKSSQRLKKHCQRYNGTEGCVQLTKVTCLGHIKSSDTNLDQESTLKSQPNISINLKVLTKHQHLD